MLLVTLFALYSGHRPSAGSLPFTAYPQHNWDWGGCSLEATPQIIKDAATSSSLFCLCRQKGWPCLCHQNTPWHGFALLSIAQSWGGLLSRSLLAKSRHSGLALPWGALGESLALSKPQSPLNKDQAVLGDFRGPFQPWHSVSLFRQQPQDTGGRRAGVSGQDSPPQGKKAKTEIALALGEGGGRPGEGGDREGGGTAGGGGDRPSPEL